jgi:hypothetical protein
MGWPESVTYLLLVVLGYALTRIIDLAIDWHRSRLLPRGEPAGPETHLSATARQRLLERRAVYARFRSCVHEAVEAAVNQGHGSYGMLYQIRDAYGDLLRHAPTTITHAADSVIRCVTLLVNLGPSDQRYAMFTRALKLFDEECECDHGLKISPGAPHHIEYSVLGGEASSPPVASPKENRSESVRAPT